jgi:membrane associated rhomboid family serine protease
MLLLPIATDAPLAHPPLATVGMVVATVLVYGAVGGGPTELNAGLWLDYGQGLHPFQWLSSNFVHRDLTHLLGNMAFLWVFGLIVEGKLGWAGFLGCYLGIGLVQSMLEQILTLGYAGPPFATGGASSAVFGIMAMAAIWAPANDIIFLVNPNRLWFRSGFTRRVPVGGLALVYVGLNLLTWAYGGWVGLLHLSGAALGAPVAIALVRKGIVDCEGWDALTLLRHDRPSHFSKLEEHRQAVREVARQRAGDAQRLADARQKFQRLLDAGDFVAAHALRPSLVDADGGVLLAEAHLRRLAFGLRDARAWPEAADVMEEYVRLYPLGAEGMRIGLAHIRAGWLDQPHEALAVLDGLDEDQLTPDDVALAERIRRKARAMIVARSKSG